MIGNLVGLQFLNVPPALRGLWLTARRAGPRRLWHRLERRVRLRWLDPRFGQHLYPAMSSDHSTQPPPSEATRALLRRLVQLRQDAPTAEMWDTSANALILLNQAPFPLDVPIRWSTPPVADPLWSFQLHSWEWAWSKLLVSAQRDHLLTLWKDWIEQVPVGRGLAWEPYPTSRRLVVWCAMWHLLEADDFLPYIAQHAAFLRDHLEHDLDNNHLIANAKALAWAGLLFPTLAGAPKWREEGLSELWRALRQQVREDGGHVENSASYHVAVWLDALETARLCDVLGEPVPTAARTRIMAMRTFALALRRPDGRLPMLNDSIQDEPLPLSTLIAFSSEQWGQSEADYLQSRGDVVKMADTESPTSVSLANTQIVVFRAHTALHNTYLLFDAGELGPLYCPGHGHADTLGIELWGKGQPLIMDPGTYQYVAGAWRDYFRSTVAHSTATVDGVDQSCFVGAFRVADLARSTLIDVGLQGVEQYATGQHDGYTRLADPVVHRRHIRFQPPNRFHIEDSFTGHTKHQLTLHFQLAPCQPSTSGQVAEAVYTNNVRLRLTARNDVPGTWSLEPGWISETWYRKDSSQMLRYHVHARLPITLHTTLEILD